MSFRDPIVEEVRAIREAYAAKFNFNLGAIYADIKRREKESGRTYVSFPPKRVDKAGTPIPKNPS